MPRFVDEVVEYASMTTERDFEIECNDCRIRYNWVPVFGEVVDRLCFDFDEGTVMSYSKASGDYCLIQVYYMDIMLYCNKQHEELPPIL